MKYQKHFKILLSLAMTTPVVFVPITNVYAGNETVSLGETGYIYDTTETRETPYEEDGMDTSLYTDPYYTSDTYLETPHPDYLFTPEYPHSEYPPTPGYTHETEYPYTPGYTHDTEYPPTPGYTHETEYPYTSGYTHDTEYSPTPGYTHETEYPYNSEYIHEAEYPYTMGEHFIPNTHNEIDNTYSNYSHSGLTTSEVYGNDKSTYEVSKEKPVDNKTVKMESNEAKVVPAPAAEVVKPVKAEAKVEPKAESKVQPKVEAKAEGKVQPKVEAKAEGKVQPKVEAKAEGKVQPKVEAKVESKVQPKVESKTESKAETIVEKVKPATEEVKVVSKHIEIKDVVAESEIEAVMGKLTDVTSTKAPYDAIKKVMTKGLMQGYKDNSFKPEKEITRAEAAQVLAKTYC